MSDRDNEIRSRLNAVKENIANACKKSGRNIDDITLIAVSKTKPDEDISSFYELGVRDFGENYVQELAGKMERLHSDIRWHMIGHLQRNKVKYLIGKVAAIHSVDSLRLAQEINDRSVANGIITEIMAEVNISFEDSKYGLNPSEITGFAKSVSEMRGLRLTGLMTSAPYVSDGEENRIYFKKMRELLVDINAKSIDNIKMDKLSMGMTCDYITAIEEGATHVRVGTALFGARNYAK